MKVKNLIIYFALITYSFSCFANSIQEQTEQGDPLAQYELASKYINSNPSDYEQALNWLNLSAKQGYEPAVSLLQKLTNKGHDRWGDFGIYSFFTYYDIDNVEQLENCKSFSLQGNSLASLLIARYYLFYAEEYEKAISYLTKVFKDYKPIPEKFNDPNGLEQFLENVSGFIDFADDGFMTQSIKTLLLAETCALMGYCFEHGYGVNKNLNEAIDYYLMCDITHDDFVNVYNSGNHKSNINLILNKIGNKALSDEILNGLGFIDGWMPNPTPYRIYSKVYYLLIKTQSYELCNSYERIKQQDVEQYHKTMAGKPFYQKDESLISRIGICNSLWFAERFYKGLGVQKDSKKAFMLFYKLVNNTDAIWEEGTGFTESYPDIYADACYRLYECYANGYGTDIDLRNSEKYYRLALAYGSSSALEDSQKKYEILYK